MAKKLKKLLWPTIQQVHILMALERRKTGLRGVEICETAPKVLHAPSIYQILRKCVWHGWVSKHGHNADASWRITPQGRKALKAYRVLYG